MSKPASGGELLAQIHFAGFAVSPETLEIAEPANDKGPPRFGERPHAHAPGYIHACHECKWKLATWKKSEPTAVQWRTARCNSWRHAGPCARKKASEDYARIAEALAKHDRSSITYAVLTLDPSAWTGEGWEGFAKKRERREEAKHDKTAIGEAYKALCERWTVFAAAVKRKWGKFQYVSTVECHRSGWPHLNVVFVNDELAQEVSGEARRLHLWGRKSRGREAARRVFGDMLESAGFGRIAFIESALAIAESGTDQLAAYIAKLSGAAGGVWDGEKRGLTAAADDAPAGEVVHSIEGHTVGEVTKLSQAPTIAPSHFRRLRSSKGFLPPKRRDPDITGALFDEHGQEMGQSVGDRMLAAAKAADTLEAVRSVMEQTTRIDDKYRNRMNWIDDDGREVKLPQPRILRVLAATYEVLNAKLEGSLPLRNMLQAQDGPRIALAPLDGMALTSEADVHKWLGQVGPGMDRAVRTYTIGNRYYLPQEPKSP